MPSKTRNSSTTAIGDTQSTRKSSRGASVNRVILTGRLVATPELRTTGSGLHVTTVRIVTNDREQPEFHDVVLWRQMADFATTYMAKGRLAYVEGRLQSRAWEAADGSRRRTVEVVADRFQAISPKIAGQPAA
jgi:single-strand DNA-binding protein